MSWLSKVEMILISLHSPVSSILPSKTLNGATQNQYEVQGIKSVMMHLWAFPL